jgi:hypothetical protein
MAFLFYFITTFKEIIPFHYGIIIFLKNSCHFIIDKAE